MRYRHARLNALVVTSLLATLASAPFASDDPKRVADALARLVSPRGLTTKDAKGEPLPLGPSWNDPHVTLPPATSVDVVVPAHGRVRAGHLPVSIGRPAKGVVPSKVTVRMLGKAEAERYEARGLAFEVTRADGGTDDAAVDVELDYSGIAQAYGGNFASRLRLSRLGCAGDVCAPEPVAGATNDVEGTTLAATVPVRPRPRAGTTSATGTYTTYGASSGASGSDGNYTATPLAGSDGWEVGIGSGAFTYSYDMPVPPAIAGAAPKVGLSYSSQSVDGRTVAQNGQPSIVGEGWSTNEMYIERKFATCSNGNDFCWDADNEYYLHFGSQSGEIIRKPNTNEWRLRGQDPAYRIRSFGAANNGDNDGEYFVLFTPDGTKYWFGFGTEPRNPTTTYTHSTYTVPVYGGSGEPCYNATASASWCQQAWRWNVDRVLDTNDNVMSYFYTKYFNYYSRGGLPSQSTPYVRAGELHWIEYSQRHANEDAPHPAKVSFYTSDRCSALTSCPAPTAANASSYPDVPLDQDCPSAPCLASQDAPTFWSTKKLDSLTTRILAASGSYANATTYSMSYSFPATGDGTSPSLWLHEIKRTGEIGAGTVELPTVRMTGTRLPNRVNSGTGVPPMNKWRVGQIDTELGMRVTVTYDTPRPCPVAPSYPAWNDNDYHCFPAWYTPPTGTGGWVAFHKYVVTKLVTEDMRGPTPTTTTSYTYQDTPAWHYKDSLLATSQSWDDYRGHSSVRVIAYTDGTTQRNDARYLIFRGMNGDKLTSTSSKSYTLTDSGGSTFTDQHYLRGLTLEVKRYDPNGNLFASKLSRYWAAQTINGPTGFEGHDTQYVRELRSVDRVWDTTATTPDFRDHIVEYTYDTTTAAVLTVSDLGQTAISTDGTCVKYAYTHAIVDGSSGGDTEWIVDSPYRMVKYGDVCGGATPRLDWTEYYYDNQAFMAAPVNGNVTQLWEHNSSSDISVTKTTYDAYGRVTAVVPPNENVPGGLGRAITTTYSPSTGYPYNYVKTTDIGVNGAAGHSVTSVYDIPSGQVVKTTDANGQVTSIGIDALGRTTSVTRPEDAAGVPGFTFEYNIGYGTTSRVKARKLVSGTTYTSSYDYLDGFGRVVEQQEPALDGGTGRRVRVTRFDSHGNVAAESSFFGAAGGPGTGLVNPLLTDIPQETRFGYDSAGRRNAATQYASGVSKWATRTTYYGFYQTVDAPVHGDVEHYKDVFGRTTRIVEHTTAGTTAVTKYEYNGNGDLTQVTDDAGNTWSYTYDFKHRRLSSTSPDSGTWTTTYTPSGQVESVTDNKQSTLFRVYDAKGRQTELRSGSATGTLLAQWSYDGAIPNGKGLLHQATRYEGANAYRTTVLSYDGRGRTTARRLTVPASEGPLAGDYDYSYAYDQMNRQTAVTMPAAGGLPAETVATTYNVAGLPTTMTSGVDSYVTSTAFDAAGRITGRTLKSGTDSVVRTYAYDATAGRLERLTSARGASPVEDLTFQYDAENNVLSVTDALAGAGGVAQRECFRYGDGLNRLTRAFTAGAACTSATLPDHAFGVSPYDLTFAYDDTTRLTSVTDGMSSPSTGTTYAYTAPGHYYAPAAIGANTYSYDENGNQSARTVGGVTSALAWTPEQLLASVTPSGGTATTFVYDQDGHRLVRRTGSTATLYLEGMELTTTSGAAPVATRYYGSTHVRTPSGVSVVLRNHQNSSSVAVDSSGTVTRQRYLPFGGRRGTTPAPGLPTERGFLDKTEDPTTGLVAMGARYYDGPAGAFVSPDPLVAQYAPRSLNPYLYSQGNPTSHSDPTGLMNDVPDASAEPLPDHDSDKDPDPQPVPSKPKDHDTQVQTVGAFIKAGVMAPDVVSEGLDLTASEQKLLMDLFYASPCFGDNYRETCRGNMVYVNECVLAGKGGCQALQEKIYLGAETIRSKTLDAMTSGMVGEIGDFIAEIAEVLPDTPYAQLSLTVLGKWEKGPNSYVNSAKLNNANYYENPDWNEMSPEGRWNDNKEFLRKTAEMGSIVYLSHSGKNDPGGTFARELEYMQNEAHYEMTADGHWLLPPPPAGFSW
ncbi:MAG TPA: RHS repeat-associated core domain-containing protein [Frankiaceae bacterium]|jgi:RHS repeat-associated protein|nr:RHS repeat-associated core domain-containing protein [Frankiaceae bacterium]